MAAEIPDLRPAPPRIHVNSRDNNELCLMSSAWESRQALPTDTTIRERRLRWSCRMEMRLRWVRDLRKPSRWPSYTWERNHTDAPICKSNRDDLAGREKRLWDSARPRAIAMIAKIAKQLRWYHDACGWSRWSLKSQKWLRWCRESPKRSRWSRNLWKATTMLPRVTKAIAKISQVTSMIAIILDR